MKTCKLLPEICKIQYGYPFDSSLFSESGNFPLIRIRDVRRGYTETYTSECCSQEYIVNYGDILIGMDGEFNIAKWSSTQAYLNQRVCKLIPHSCIDKGYLFFFMPKALKEIEARTPFATVKHLSAKELNRITVPFPKLEEQQRISFVLQSVVNIIELQKTQLQKIDQLAKSRFIEMFGDPVTNPKGWESGTIRDIASEVKYGTSSPATEGGKHIYLRMNNITYDGHLDLSNLKYIDLPDDQLAKYQVQKGDVLFNRTNSKELVGKTCVFKEDIPMVIAGYIIRVRVNARANPEYLSAILNSKYGKRTLLDMCKAIVGQANINAQELQNIDILIPPISLQNEFATFIEELDKSKFTIRKSLEKLETLYRALLQEYFG